MRLQEWLSRPEGKTLEFKRDLSSPGGVLRTLVAFANSSGGLLLIGVEDGTRHVCGLAEPVASEQRLVNLISDSIAPRLVPEIELLAWRSKHLLVVRVHAGSLPPHHLAAAGVEQGTYVRVGSTNRRADHHLVDELRRSARGEAFDEQPMADLNSEAIDFRLASESFEEFRALQERDLEPLGLLASHHGRLVPTVGGVLLFGHERLRYFPDAWIQAGCFAGVDKRRLADHREVRVSLVQAIPEAIGFLQRHLAHSFEVGDVRRVERWQLPPAAIREAIINAVVHADYSQRGAPIRVSLFTDRLEVESPGLLPAGLTVDDLLRGVSKLRNRVIGRVFQALGLVEQWGSGVQRIVGTCEETGLSTPRFEELAARFRVTLFTTRNERQPLDKVNLMILDLLGASGGMLPGRVALEIGLTTRATRSRPAALIRAELVQVVGAGPHDPRRIYVRTARHR